MSGPTPPLAADRPAAPVVYQPLSGLAVLSVFVAGGYALLVAVLAVAAFAFHVPLFLGTWTLLIPAAGAALALAAQRQIRLSEGTRSGAALANAAFWLSLGVGVSYAAFYFASFKVVATQAGEFADRWFDKLLKGEVAAAFLDTQDPDQRQEDNPGDRRRMMIRYGLAAGGRKGPLLVFQDSDMVRLVYQGGPGTTVERLGVGDWGYEQGGYKVSQVYRVTSGEGVFDMAVTAVSKDSRQKRQWRIVWNPYATYVAATLSRTPLGEAVQQWTQGARGFAAQWLSAQYEGRLDLAYLYACPPAQRDELARRYTGAVVGQAVGVVGGVLGQPNQGMPVPSLAPLLHRESLCRAFLPGFEDYAAGTLVRHDGLEAPERLRGRIIRDAKDYFRHNPEVFARLGETAGYPVRLQDPERLQVTFDVTLDAVSHGAAQPAYHCEAQLLVESDPGPVAPVRAPQWQLKFLTLIRGDEPPPEAGPGGR